ncbi:hypothetical protein [Williamsia sp. 1138]|uniref:hypothetical protein n=1 Tax=Williamsia sp. 1138 TaxID=1903117 RepID=UPI00117D2B3C|nr:hypothetical protein [Williamsia sp. 1138]
MSVTPPPYGRDPYGAPQPGRIPAPDRPQQVERPPLVSSLAIATELWVVVTIAQIVAVCGQFTLASDQIDQVRDDMARQGQPVSYALVVTMVIVISIVMIGGICGTLTWFARSGRNWARLGLGFLSFYLVVQTVYAFFVAGADHWTMIPTVIGGVGALGAGVLLLHRDSDQYCKDMAAWRAEKKRPASVYPPGGYPPVGGYPPQGQYPGQYPSAGQYQQYGQPGYPPQQYQPPAPQNPPDTQNPQNPPSSQNRQPGSDTGERQ